MTPGLDACVHCGFCLPACPTYVRLGDEADSPRGRLHLMRAVEEGRLPADSDAFQIHLDRCLGCRACEPVCPSGVPYGALLEQARARAREARPAGLATRLLLSTFETPLRSRVALAAARLLRDTGLAAALARWLPRSGTGGAVRRALLMLVGSAPWNPTRLGRSGSGHAAPVAVPVGADPVPRASLALLTGCVQAGLFTRVNDATAAVLEVNGYTVRAAPGQVCCGALHAHAGDLEGARRLARINIAAFDEAGADGIAVNAAGCGAALAEYGTWLREDSRWAERARRLSERVADVSELLASAGPRVGAPLDGVVAYHPPCHLEHARGVIEPPRTVLRAIPGLELRTASDVSECCGGAGIYGLTHPELGGRIGADKALALADTGADCVATGNPGCMMQVAAFLHDEGGGIEVAHPVELLHESYRRAGLVP